MTETRRAAPCLLAIPVFLVAACRVDGREAKGPRCDSDRALAAATETAAKLTVFQEPPNEYDDSFCELPSEAERLLRLLHRQLADWAIAWLNENRETGRTPEEIQAELQAALGAAGIGCPKAIDPGPALACKLPWFGAIQRLRFERPQPEALPRHFALMISLSTGFVEDAALYLLERGPKGFRPVLEWSTEVALASEPLAEDDPFRKDVRKGLNELDFQLSPPDPEGRFFIFAISRQPGWPSSWGAISWAILRPRPDARSPKVLVRDSAGQRNCYEDCFRFSADSETLVLEFNGRADLLSVLAGYDQSLIRRQWRVLPDRAEEYGAPASDARSFVSVFLSTAWGKARAWADAAEPRLEEWHAALSRALAAAAVPDFGNRWADACPPDSRHWVVELIFDPEIVVPAGRTSGEEGLSCASRVYVHVEEIGDDFLLRNIALRPPDGEGWTEVGACLADP